MLSKLGKLYVLLTAAVIVFQVAVIAGAPVGSFTQGGSTPGVLGLVGRITAGVSIVTLLLGCYFVAAKTGLMSFGSQSLFARAGFWFVLVMSVLGFVLNWITPSQNERLVWGPVASVLLVSVVAIAVLTRKERGQSVKNPR